MTTNETKRGGAPTPALNPPLLSVKSAKQIRARTVNGKKVKT